MRFQISFHRQRQHTGGEQVTSQKRFHFIKISIVFMSAVSVENKDVKIAKRGTQPTTVKTTSKWILQILIETVKRYRLRQETTKY